MNRPISDWIRSSRGVLFAAQFAASVFFASCSSEEVSSRSAATEDAFDSMLAIINNTNGNGTKDPKDVFESSSRLGRKFSDEEQNILLGIAGEGRLVYTAGSVDDIENVFSRSYLAALALWANSEESRRAYCNLLEDKNKIIATRVAASLLPRGISSLCAGVFSPYGVECSSQEIQDLANNMVELYEEELAIDANQITVPDTAEKMP